MIIVVGILLFALLVVVHELGHFLVAKRNGVEVEEFGIGFPPKIAGKKVGDTEYTFNLIPLGGFVKLKGESDEDQGPGSFGSSRLWAKAKILLAGVGMNILAAIAIITVLAWTGLPQFIPGQFQVENDRNIISEKVMVAQVSEDAPIYESGLRAGSAITAINETPVTQLADIESVAEDYQHEEVAVRYVSPGSEEPNEVEMELGSPQPGYLGVELEEGDGESVIAGNVLSGSAAEALGMESGDRILSLDRQQITSNEQLIELASERAGETVTVTYNDGRETITGEVRLGTGGVIEGVNLLDEQTSRYSWAAPLVGIGLTAQMVVLVLSVLAEIIAGIFTGGGEAAVEQLAGPVGVVAIMQNLGGFGWEYLLFIIASISVSLAVFNALPIPALDGGRLAVIAGARALRRQLTAKVENTIHGIGFILLIGLLIVITYIDVQRFF